MAALSSLNLGLLLPNSRLITCDAINILAATVCGVILLPYRPSGTSAGDAQRVHSFSVAKADIFAACESSEEQEQWAGKASSSLSPKSIYEAPTVCAPCLLRWGLAPPALITYFAWAGCSGKEAQSPSSRSSGWRNTSGPPRYCKGHCDSEVTAIPRELGQSLPFPFCPAGIVVLSLFNSRGCLEHKGDQECASSECASN